MNTAQTTLTRASESCQTLRGVALPGSKHAGRDYTAWAHPISQEESEAEEAWSRSRSVAQELARLARAQHDAQHGNHWGRESTLHIDTQEQGREYA